MRKWDLTGELKASGSNLGKKKKQEEEPQMVDHPRWTELVYNYSGASTSTAQGVPSTHHRSSGPKKFVHAPGAPK